MNEFVDLRKGAATRRTWMGGVSAMLVALGLFGAAPASAHCHRRHHGAHMNLGCWPGNHDCQEPGVRVSG